jgi:uncharacterized protein with PIN domain
MMAGEGVVGRCSRNRNTRAFEDIITGGERCVMSAVNIHETATVLAKAMNARLLFKGDDFSQTDLQAAAD